MTTRLQIADAYRRACRARVTALTDRGIVLDQSCFFGPDDLVAPDRGRVAGHDVVGLRDLDGSLVHVIAPDIGGGTPAERLRVGELVDCTIDWLRRRRIMALHTAQHLVELAFQSTHDLTAVSSAPAGDHSLAMKPVLGSGCVDLEAINGWVETAVRDDLPMTVSAEPAPPYRWLWHLDGYGHRYCDGLHVRSTGEIDAIHVSHSDRATDEVLVSLERSSPDV